MKCEWCGGTSRYELHTEAVCVDCAMAWIRAGIDHPEITYVLRMKEREREYRNDFVIQNTKRIS